MAMRLGIVGAPSAASCVGCSPRPATTKGREVRVKTPFNDAIVDFVNSFPVGTLKPELKNIDPLVRMLPR